ncbi:glycosyltransferase family 4 protein [Archaeoglobus veneficus]|uniref:Glycosyl transferase group 1 n=1 Tax=Archaeoglobus veneficus (strain DSM 11195 / SNP6) TaxID=693661 RepID=F2KR93_ARCVS|nr:glycosyltransferase family 4 protein [Archaeoglobus veneficus]AEA46730.1 glycosyl transferase group 1 [Archaeoglobus veneficus SNP6]
MKKARVAMATPYYPPHIGGVEIHSKNLAEGLKARGYDVVVISSTGSDVVVPSIPIPYSPIPLFFPNINANIYHSHVPSPFFARKLAKLAVHSSKPHIVTYHNDVVVPPKVGGHRIPSSIARWVEKINDFLIEPVLEKADVIIATTRSYAESSPILSKFMEKVEIVPNAVNVSEFTPGKDAGEREAIVLYVGRLVEYKGLPLLIKAMAEVQRRINAKLVVVGEGEDRKAFERLAAKLGVNVTFTGRLPKDDVVRWMGKARVLVLPSFSRLEAFGIVLLEAMACSTPVLAANIPGVSEVASEGGLTFSNDSELAELIVKLLSDDKLATELGNRGRKAVEQKYDWNVVLDRIEEIYGALL